MTSAKRRADAGFARYGWAAADGARAQLTRAGVVRAALELLDSGGVDGLTMRVLANRLGVKAASLYNHVRNKGELLALMADAICAEIPDPDPSRPWREQAETMALQVRRVLMAHRDAARVLAATPPLGPNRVRLVEQVLRLLQKAGFPSGLIADASSVLNSYVVGFVLDETVGRPAANAVSARRAHEEVRRWFKSLPKKDYPTLTALADELIDAPADRRFETGLRALLDGFELRLARGRRG